MTENPGPIALTVWNPEDREAWASNCKAIAFRNLWVSTACLVAAFCLWMAWPVINVRLIELGFPLTKDQLFTLAAIAGLSGATLRIPNSFLISLAGGRNTIAVTTSLLIIPAVWLGVALHNPDTPFMVFVIIAALTGIGGGNFASSMSNISLFFPKSMKGLALGLNAGLGNAGVSIGQFLIPIVTSYAIFGSLAGGPVVSRAVAGNGAAGPLYIQNAGFIWVPIIVVCSILSWVWMNNLPVHKIGSTAISVGRVLGLHALGLIGAAVGISLLLWLSEKIGDIPATWVTLPVTIIVTVYLMKLVPGKVRADLEKQYQIFRSKHTWFLTYLYIMTFGSFIGYSITFALIMKVVFGTLSDYSTPNPNGPNPLHYAWLGPLLGSIMRPLGGYLSDKFGGARVTHYTTILMIICTLALSVFLKAAAGSDTPQDHFIPFLLLFLGLFTLTGVGNGSVFAQVPKLFQPALAGPVVGWISAIAAYGAFILPKIFGAQVNNHTPEYALYGFAVFYLSALALNWYYYARRGAEAPC